MSSFIKQSLLALLMLLIIVLGLWGFGMLPFGMPLMAWVLLGSALLFWCGYCAHVIHQHISPDASTVKPGRTKALITCVVSISFVWVAFGLYYEWLAASSVVFVSGEMQGFMMVMATLALIGWLSLTFKQRKNLYNLAKLWHKQSTFKKSVSLILVMLAMYPIIGFLFFRHVVPSWSLIGVGALVGLTLVVCIINYFVEKLKGKGHTNVDSVCQMFCQCLDKCVSIAALLLHVSAEGGPPAQGVLGRTHNRILALSAWLFGTSAELAIDYDALLVSAHDNHNEEEPSEARTSMAKKGAYVACALAAGLCAAVLMVYSWPQLMSLLGYGPIPFTLSGLGSLIFVLFVSLIALGGLGCAVAIYNAFIEDDPQYIDDNACDGQHEHELRFFESIYHILTQANTRTFLCYGMAVATLVFIFILSKMYWGTIVGLTLTAASFLIIKGLWGCCHAACSQQDSDSAPKKPWYKRVLANIVVPLMAQNACLMTGVVGAFLFAKLMGFSSCVLLILVGAAALTEFHFYRKSMLHVFGLKDCVAGDILCLNEAKHCDGSLSEGRSLGMGNKRNYVPNT